MVSLSLKYRLLGKLFLEQYLEEEQDHDPREEHDAAHVVDEGVEADVSRGTNHQVRRITDERRDTTGVGQQRSCKQVGNRRHFHGTADQDDQRAKDDDRGDVVEQQ